MYWVLSEDFAAKTHPEELAENRVVRLARPALDVFEILCQPEAYNLEHTVERLVGGANGSEGVGGVDVVPVLEVRRGFEELRRERESNRCEIGNANESIVTIPLVRLGQVRGRSVLLFNAQRGCICSARLTALPKNRGKPMSQIRQSGGCRKARWSCVPLQNAYECSQLGAIALRLLDGCLDHGGWVR